MPDETHICLSVREIQNLINGHEPEKHAAWQKHLANCRACRERCDRLAQGRVSILEDVFDWIDGTKRILH